jgi:hypothetical protein
MARWYDPAIIHERVQGDDDIYMHKLETEECFYDMWICNE